MTFVNNEKKAKEGLMKDTGFEKKIEIISIFYIVFWGAILIAILFTSMDRFTDIMQQFSDHPFSVYEIFALHVGYILMLILSSTYFVQSILLHNELAAEQFVKVLRGIRWLYDVFGVTETEFKKCISQKTSVPHYGLYRYFVSFSKYTYTLTRHIDNRWTHAFLLYSKLLLVVRMTKRLEILNRAHMLYMSKGSLFCDEFRLQFNYIEKYEIENLKNLEKLKLLFGDANKRTQTFEIQHKPGPIDKVQDVLHLLGYQSTQNQHCSLYDSMSLEYIINLLQVCPKIAPQAIYCVVKESQNRYKVYYFASEFALLSINEDVIQSHNCQMRKMKDLLSMRHDILSYIGGVDPRKIKVVLLGFDEVEEEFIRKFSKNERIEDEH